jgi:hypothetical protein
MTQTQEATQMAKKVDCYVLRTLQNRCAFAVRGDNGEGVYIPRTVYDALAPQVSDCIEAVIVPNNHGRANNTPWQMVRGYIIEEEEE